VKKACFQEETFHLVASDYLLNFINPQDIPSLILNMSKLLVRGGILAGSVEVIPERKGIKKLTGLVAVRNRLKEMDLKKAFNKVEALQLRTIERANLKGVAKTSYLTADCLVFGLQRKVAKN
jgi:hypothetical protein